MVTQRILIRCNNNLTQCSNRIICHVVQINNQSFGLPLNLATIKLQQVIVGILSFVDDCNLSNT